MALYAVSREELGRRLGTLSWPELLALYAVGLVGLGVQGLQFREICRVFGLRLTPREWMGLTCVNNMMAYSAPAHAGTLVRAAYLQRTRGFPLAGYAALTVSSHVGILALVSVLAAVVDFAWGGGRLAALFALVAVLVLGGGAAIARVAALARRLGPLAPHADAFRAGLARWRHAPASAWRAGILTLGVFGLRAAGLGLAFAAVDAAVGAPVALVLQACVALSALAAPTPANLGVKEGVIAAGAAALHVDPASALLAALVDRAVGVTEAAATGLVASHLLLGDVAARRR